MCALLVCLLSFLLLLLLLLFVHLPLSYLHASPPHSWQSLFTCFIFFCFSLHIPPLLTLSLFLTLIYWTQFSLFSFLSWWNRLWVVCWHHLLRLYTHFCCRASLQFASALFPFRVFSSAPSFRRHRLSFLHFRAWPSLDNRFLVPLALITVCVRFHSVN